MKIRICFVLSVLAGGVGRFAAAPPDRVMESILPALSSGKSCWSTLELRNLGDRPVALEVEGHRGSGALTPLVGQAGVRLRLEAGERRSYKLDIEEETSSAWIRIREIIPAPASSPAVAVGGRTECVKGNRLVTAALEVAYPTRNPWFDSEVSEIRGDLLTLVNVSEHAAQASLCYSAGGLYSRPREGQPPQELAPLCSAAFEVRIPPFGTRQFPVEREGNSRFTIKTKGDLIVLQMLRPIETNWQVYTVDSTIRFEGEPSPSERSVH